MLDSVALQIMVAAPENLAAGQATALVADAQEHIEQLKAANAGRTKQGDSASHSRQASVVSVSTNGQFQNGHSNGHMNGGNDNAGGRGEAFIRLYGCLIADLSAFQHTFHLQRSPKPFLACIFQIVDMPTRACSCIQQVRPRRPILLHR